MKRTRAQRASHRPRAANSYCCLLPACFSHRATAVLALVLWLFPWPGSFLTSGQTRFFLPKNSVAAAYVLGRLSDRELMDAPRSEFVYVALLKRLGLDRKYRQEALTGLATLRHTDRLTELLRALAELDGEEQSRPETRRDLGSLLVESDRAKLAAHRDQLQALAVQSKATDTRQIGWAGWLIADGPEAVIAKSPPPEPAQRAEQILAICWIPAPGLRAEFYPAVKPLLYGDNSPELRRAAMMAIATIPGHDSEIFTALSTLLQEKIEPKTAIAGLARLPRSAWLPDQLQPIVEAIVAYLKQTPAEERTGADFTQALQFGSELATALPSPARQQLGRTLRSLGPAVFLLRALYEQMRFDKEQLVVEAAKPLVITLQNEDAMPHNLAILAPGSLKEIGLAAEKMAPEPDAQGRLYVPVSPKVLQATRLVSPGQQGQLAFNAPLEPGDYPFACTFPGHWLRMAGTLTVVSNLDDYLANHAAVQPAKLTDWKLADFAADWSRADPPANPANGQALFNRLACVQCHRFGSIGYAFGPDLTDVFKRYQNDRSAVLVQVLEPSRIVLERYRNFDFLLKNGESVVGLVLKEDEQTVTVQTGPADSLIQKLPKSQIERRRVMTSSPMPVGLLSSLSKQEIFDLLAFLATGGHLVAHDHHLP